MADRSRWLIVSTTKSAVVRRDTIAQPHARIQGSLVVNGLECSAHALKSTTPWTVQNRLLSDWLLENELRRREKEQEGSREPEACVACLAPRGFISVLKERPQDNRCPRNPQPPAAAANHASLPAFTGPTSRPSG